MKSDRRRVQALTPIELRLGQILHDLQQASMGLLLSFKEYQSNRAAHSDFLPAQIVSCESPAPTTDN
jgi:hypothetical protein